MSCKVCPNCQEAFTTGFHRGWQAGNVKEYYNHNQILGEFRAWIAALLQIKINKKREAEELKVYHEKRAAKKSARL